MNKIPLLNFSVMVIFMPYVPVPKDLSKVKRKIALNLTKRQLICFSLAAAVGVPAYFLTRNYMRTDISVVLMVILMLPFFFCAMYEKDGLPFEKILLNYIRVRFLRPKIRPYQTENIYQLLQKQAKMKKEVHTIGKNVKPDKTTGKTGKALRSRKKTGKAK